MIALTEDGEFAGFSYIESWGGKSFVANSGLIVAHKFRGMGLAKKIKEQTFILSRKLFPDAKIFSITTGAAVKDREYRMCLCTGLLYDPKEHLTIHHPGEEA